MANFKGHLRGAVVVGSIAGANAFMAAELSAEQSLMVFFAGILGGLAPDVDGENTHPNTLFKVLTVGFGGFFVAVHQDLLWIPVFLVAAVSAWLLADKIMRHRGYVHSIVVGGGCMSLGIVAFLSLFGITEAKAHDLMFAAAWFGFMVHLLLDEFASVYWRRVLSPVFWIAKINSLSKPKRVRNAQKYRVATQFFGTAFELFGKGKLPEFYLLLSIGVPSAYLLWGETLLW